MGSAAETANAATGVPIGADWLEQNLPDILRRAPARLLRPAAEEAPAPRRASVLVPIVLARPEPFILLTRRADNLRHHPGQVSFPGGRIDPTDRDPEHAALREAAEEIALETHHCRVVGRLAEHVTSTGFHVTPVVALVARAATWSPAPAEVSAILTLPIGNLLDPDAARRHGAQFRGAWHEYWVWRHPEHPIWGATAGILMSLAELLRARCGTISRR